MAYSYGWRWDAVIQANALPTRTNPPSLPFIADE